MWRCQRCSGRIWLGARRSPSAVMLRSRAAGSVLGAAVQTGLDPMWGIISLCCVAPGPLEMPPVQLGGSSLLCSSAEAWRGSHPCAGRGGLVVWHPPLPSGSGLILQGRGGLQGCPVLGGGALLFLSCLSEALCVYK